MTEDATDKRAQAERLMELGADAMAAGRHDAARRYVTAALSLHEEIGDQDGQIRVTQRLGVLELLDPNDGPRQNTAAAMKSLDEDGLPHTSATGSEDIHPCKQVVEEGMIAQKLDRPDVARRCFEEAMSLALDRGHLLCRAAALRQLGLLERHEGNDSEARRSFLYAQRIYRATKSFWGIGNIHMALGQLDLHLSRLSAAGAHFRAALRAFRRAETARVSEEGLGSVHENLGFMHLATGDFDAARSHFQEAIFRYAAIGGELGIAQAHCGLGYVELGLSKLNAARTHFEESLCLSCDAEDERRAADAHRGLGDVELRLAKLDAARTHYQESLRLYGEKAGRSQSR